MDSFLAPPQRPSCKKSLHVDSDGVFLLGELLSLLLRELRPGKEAQDPQGATPGVFPRWPQDRDGLFLPALVSGAWVLRKKG